MTGEATTGEVRVVVAGPSGCGKTTVGMALAAALGAAFVDADDLHPSANVAKMMSGHPLDDDDRVPWLDAVGRRIGDNAGDLVVACSALKRAYRDRIRAFAPTVVFVELRVPGEELERRMRARVHFMPPALLASQLAAWEPLQPDERGADIDAGDALDVVVQRATAAVAKTLRRASADSPPRAAAVGA